MLPKRNIETTRYFGNSFILQYLDTGTDFAFMRKSEDVMSMRGTISTFNPVSPVRTLATPFTLGGHGLHGNKPCTVTVAPAKRGGLRFLHTPSGVTIPALSDFVGDLSLATTLVKDGVCLSTVEHLLSALSGLGVDHALISVDAEEIPILDGSAAPWVEAISQAGLVDLHRAKSYMKVLKPVEVCRKNRRISVVPYAGLSLSYSIDFPVPSIGCQSLELTLTPDKYRRELSEARTFCLRSEIDAMHSRGLALGGNLSNAVVFDEKGHLNECLRFEDEAVRHKMLDMIGDLALLGAPLIGHVEAHAAGHAMHVALVRELIATPEAWTMIEFAPTVTHRVFRPEFSPELAAV
jgi:UDP-3-O-[3-hydroxymyristoyl] N-acetylglucosamine deacetylase